MLPPCEYILSVLMATVCCHTRRQRYDKAFGAPLLMPFTPQSSASLKGVHAHDQKLTIHAELSTTNALFWF
ncbi:hypothetical protein L13192_01931 [Pyrenophora tritici-repentis]|nr:hypothetical protein L13192_01931 [Pyrenophora tritici-repentis]